MQIFVVTSKTEDKNVGGVILEAQVRCYGVFTDGDVANGIADKYNGSVCEMTLAVEYVPQDGYVLQRWTNPGYSG